MSKYAVDDPWFEYVEIPRSKQTNYRNSGKGRRALARRIAKFRRKHQQRG